MLRRLFVSWFQLTAAGAMKHGYLEGFTNG